MTTILYNENVAFKNNKIAAIIIIFCFSSSASQKVLPSAGCFNLLFLSEHISIRRLCSTFSIPVFRFQFFIAGTLFFSTTPVLESIQLILIFEVNLTVGGTAGYSWVQ
jgi:hypothetical protein